MADVMAGGTPDAAAELSPSEQQLVRELTDRAREGGLKLTDEDGLLGRDVDLFVGVASIGNDPAWEDGGPNGRFARYWTSRGLGELDQTAQTRRDVLARLLPRLAIADQCTIESRFLHVKGTRHSYRIHLGSGNVMITPGDRYLCIVPRREAGPDLGYLPFEGDLTLSVIVSKAMLLASSRCASGIPSGKSARLNRRASRRW